MRARIEYRALLAAMALTGAVAGSARGSDLNVHGIVDVTAIKGREAVERSDGDGQFDAYRVTLFADSRAAGPFQAFTEFITTDQASQPIRNFGAFVMFTPNQGRDLHLIAGKIPWLIGSYGARSHSDRKALISTPLIYSFHSSLLADAATPGAEELLDRASDEAAGLKEAEYAEDGMAIVDEAWWDFGGMVTGSFRPLEFAAGLSNGTPGAPQAGVDGNHRKSALGRLGLSPIPSLRVGVSGSIGPYLDEEAGETLAPGTNVNDFDQRLAMADLEVQVGHVEVRGEYAINRWETPTVGALDATGGYAEGKYALAMGAFVAARWEAMRFSEISEPGGARRPWNTDVDRIEAGVGYRFTREAWAKLVLQRTGWNARDGHEYPKLNLIAGQVSVRF